MAIKWMALECIHYRKFTHQSDVWSYGKAGQKVQSETIKNSGGRHDWNTLHIQEVSVVFVDLAIETKSLLSVK